MNIATPPADRKPFFDPMPTESPFIMAYGTLAELLPFFQTEDIVICSTEAEVRQFFLDLMDDDFIERIEIPLPGLPSNRLELCIKTGER